MNVYNKIHLFEMMDGDEVNDNELGFMQGYLEF